MSRLSKKDNSKKSVICNDCKSLVSIHLVKANCRICNKDICSKCSEASIRNANYINNGFDRQYVNCCNNCIWFDIG